MKKLLLPLISTTLLSATFSVLADSQNATQQNSQAQTREQLEKQRDHLSGVDQVASSATQANGSLLDTPVDTQDAPAQTPKP